MIRRLNLNKTKYWTPNSLTRLMSIITAAFDRRSPIHAKIIAVLTVIYVLSPIDFIPDFIPVIGWLDDAVIIPLGLWMTAQAMPPGLLDEHYERRRRKGGQVFR